METLTKKDLDHFAKVLAERKQRCIEDQQRHEKLHANSSRPRS
jgi:hypothetical protein